MRRLNKKIKRYVGMYGTISQERYDSLFKKEKDKKKKEVSKLPEIKSSKTTVQFSSARNVNNSMDSFEKEYKDFIENLKKQKAEKDAAKAETVSAPKPDESITEFKNELDEITTEIVETPIEETKSRRRKRKKTAEPA